MSNCGGKSDLILMNFLGLIETNLINCSIYLVTL